MLGLFQLFIDDQRMDEIPYSKDLLNQLTLGVVKSLGMYEWVFSRASPPVNGQDFTQSLNQTLTSVKT